MDVTLLAMAAILAGTPVPTPPPPAHVRPSTETAEIADPGSCRGSGGPVDLRRILFFENRALEFDSPEGPMRISLLGPHVDIDALNPNPRFTGFRQNIGNAVGRGENDADVVLKLGLLDDRLVVYWRETVQNRPYRQGLFSVLGMRLEAVCEGRAAGVEISD
ncbi:MAG TPA: hypothetical protein VK614_11755 [Allosphingosinicella sp.]|nr:hypothetical protein [Allosphingosinicella sp.]